MSQPASQPPESPTPKTAERRAWVRYACNLEVSCHRAGSLKDAGWPAKVVNLSAGGVGLVLRHRFEPGTPLDVELLSRPGSFRRTVPVKVVHATPVRADAEPHWLMGCVFVSQLSEADLQALLGDDRVEI